MHLSKTYLKLATIIALLPIVTSCGFVTFKEISDDERYIGLIGQRYRVKEELLIYGVNMDPAPTSTIHKYTVTTKPGIGGRGIVTRNILEVGEGFQILKVLSCTDCYFDFGPRIKIVAQVGTGKPYSSFETDFGISTYDFTFEDAGRVKMNPRYFELIE